MAMTSVVTAESFGEPFDVVLDAGSVAMGAFVVEFGVLFPTKEDPSALKASLAQILSNFATVAGRLELREGSTVVRCNNAGVPFTHECSPGCAPSLASPLAAQYFDCASGYTPSEGSPGGPPLRIKVTDFAEDGQQLVALSGSHGLMDARSFGVLLAAWSAAHHGRGSDVARATFDNSFLPASPGFGQPPLVSSEGVPATWTALQRPFAMPGGGGYAPAVTTYARSPEACAALKARYRAAEVEQGRAEPALSTNDALVGELCEVCAVKEAAVVMEIRAALGQAHFFGSAITTIEAYDADSAAAVPATLRSAVAVAQEGGAEYVRWKMGQGAGKVVPLCVNSWVRAFDLPSLRFASAASGMAIAQSMWSARAKHFAPMGLLYAIVCPEINGGVKVALLADKAVGSAVDGATCVEL